MKNRKFLFTKCRCVCYNDATKSYMCFEITQNGRGAVFTVPVALRGQAAAGARDIAEMKGRAVLRLLLVRRRICAVLSRSVERYQFFKACFCGLGISDPAFCFVEKHGKGTNYEAHSSPAARCDAAGVPLCGACYGCR